MTEQASTDADRYRFDDLTALFVNCTLKRSPGALLKRSGGVPAHGNQRSEWEAGCRFDADNPEHR